MWIFPTVCMNPNFDWWKICLYMAILDGELYWQKKPASDNAIHRAKGSIQDRCITSKLLWCPIFYISEMSCFWTASQMMALCMWCTQTAVSSCNLDLFCRFWQNLCVTGIYMFFWKEEHISWVVCSAWHGGYDAGSLCVGHTSLPSHLLELFAKPTLYFCIDEQVYHVENEVSSTLQHTKHH